MSWLTMLGITDAIIIVVVLVAICIGVRVAFEESRQDPGEYGP